MSARLTEIVVDAADPDRLAAFWCEVLGWRPTGRYQGPVEIADPGGGRPTLVFVDVPRTEKAGKNRLHLDLNPVGCSQAEEVERLIGLGARRVYVGQGEVDWIVLADPEGNEFCLLRPTLSQ